MIRTTESEEVSDKGDPKELFYSLLYQFMVRHNQLDPGLLTLGLEGVILNAQTGKREADPRHSSEPDTIVKFFNRSKPRKSPRRPPIKILFG